MAEKEKKSVATPVPEMASVHANSLEIGLVGNDFVLTFRTPRMGHIEEDGERKPAAMSETTAVVVMSVQTLMDLHIIINGALTNYQGEFGEVRTAFSMKREADEPKSS